MEISFLSRINWGGGRIEPWSLQKSGVVPTKATDPHFIPERVVEISLYDLLVQQFDPTVDAQQAELELASFRWNPLDKNALGVIPFRGHVTRLCSRAGKTGWAMKGIAIRNTFPDWLRSRVIISKSEDTFWDVCLTPKRFLEKQGKMCSIISKDLDFCWLYITLSLMKYISSVVG